MVSASKAFLLPVCFLLAALEGCSKQEDAGWVASENHLVRIDSSSWIKERFAVSRDNRRAAYVSTRDNKWFVVVDGKEGTPYHEIAPSPVFNSNGKRIAYGARRERERFVVVGGKEGERCDRCDGRKQDCF